MEAGADVNVARVSPTEGKHTLHLSPGDVELAVELNCLTKYVRCRFQSDTLIWQQRCQQAQQVSLGTVFAPMCHKLKPLLHVPFLRLRKGKKDTQQIL